MKPLLRTDRTAFKRAVLAAVITAVMACHATTPLADSTQPASTKKARLRHNSFYYSAFNKPDPFRSLIVGEFVSEKKMEVLDIGRVVLVGVVKGELDRFALLEDGRGFSYILRVGDRVRNGSVVAIGDKSMVARVSNFGQTKKFTLHLAKWEEGEQR